MSVEPVPAGSARSSTTTLAARTAGRLYGSLPRYGLVIAWLVVIIAFGATNSTFLTSGNWASILRSQAVLVVLAFALLPTLTAGDYDLSVAANLSLSSIVVAVLNTQQGWGIGASVLAGIIASVVVGAANAFLVVVVRIESLIATLGTATILAGIVLRVSNGATISGISGTLVDLVNRPKVGQLPLSFFYVLILCVALWYFAQYTPVGRRLLFVGRNRNVSRLSGLHVDRLRAGAFIGGGLLAGIAGVLYAGTSASADPTSGATLLLPAFAAAFLGSTAIYPGSFNAWGALVGAYFLATGIDGLALLGIGVYVQNLFYGGALLIAVAIAVTSARRKDRQ